MNTGDLALGCTTDCLAHHDNKQAFVFPTTGFDLKGTDRCGDGFFDGIVKVKKQSDGTEITLRDHVQATCSGKADKDAGTCALTGYTPYWTSPYADRIADEECDNGGFTDQGCDRMCKVVKGWKCYHYYHHIVTVELPYFTSICEEE